MRTSQIRCTSFNWGSTDFSVRFWSARCALYMRKITRAAPGWFSALYLKSHSGQVRFRPMARTLAFTRKRAPFGQWRPPCDDLGHPAIEGQSRGGAGG